MFKWDEGLVQVVHGFKSGVGMIRCEGRFWFGRVRGWGWFSRGGLAQVVRGFFFRCGERMIWSKCQTLG